MAKIGICVKNLTSGGAEKQAVLLANALVASHDVDFIILNGGKIHDKYVDMLDSRVRLVKFTGERKERLTRYRDYVREEAPALIFSYLTAANYYSIKASRGTSTKVVTGIRNSRLPLAKHLADAVMNRWCAVASVCNCESGKRHFARTGFRGSKIAVIPNCFENIDGSVEHGTRDIVKVITVGRFVAQKDYRTAIKAVAGAYRANRDIRFTIIGYGELESSVRQWVREEGIDDITEILINSDRIADELRDADIYLSTSLFEGISNSIMEGMNANLPVVATAVGDNDMLVKPGVNGYLTDKGDSRALAAHIAHLAADRELRQQMGRKSKELLSAGFNADIFARRYNELITKLLRL